MSQDTPASPSVEDAIGPRVALPANGAPIGVVLLCMLAAGGALFIFLGGRNPSPPKRAAAIAAAWPPAPPLLDIPPPTPPPPPQPPTIEYVYKTAPAPEPIIRYVDRIVAPPMPAAPMMPSRLNDPALVVDLGELAPAQGVAGADAAARAVTLRGRSALVPQGTLIPAVLETPIDTVQPGPVRALTSGDTRSFDGTRVLIPRGSRLVGELRAEGGGAGQTRALITWNRLLRPDGVTIRLTSPTADAVGNAGVAGQVDNHLLARMANVALQSALVVGADLASRPGNGSVVVNSPGQVLANAGQTLVPTNELKRSIRVKKGAEITIFVVRDLDFRGAAQAGP